MGTVPEAVTAMNEVGDAIAKIDYYYMLAFIFLVIGMMVSSFLVDFHPIFYVIFIISWVLAIVIGTILSIVYNTMILNTYFSTMPTVMPFASFFLDYLPWFTTILGFLLSIVMFVRTKSPGYGTV